MTKSEINVGGTPEGISSLFLWLLLSVVLYVNFNACDTKQQNSNTSHGGSETQKPTEEDQ